MAEETKRQETDYTILRQGDEPLDWMEQSDVVAANAQQAIRRYVERLPDESKPGTYIAVPSRQFQPRTVAIETKQIVKFDDEPETHPTPLVVTTAPATESTATQPPAA